MKRSGVDWISESVRFFSMIGLHVSYLYESWLTAPDEPDVVVILSSRRTVRQRSITGLLIGSNPVMLGISLLQDMSDQTIKLEFSGNDLSSRMGQSCSTTPLRHVAKTTFLGNSPKVVLAWRVDTL